MNWKKKKKSVANCYYTTNAPHNTVFLMFLGCSLASFLACIEESISEREGKQFEEGLNSKVKLDMYIRFGKEVEFKRYLHGVGDAGTRLLFKFRSGTHGLNEELGRHRGREGKSECVLCGAECESVVGVFSL